MQDSTVSISKYEGLPCVPSRSRAINLNVPGLICCTFCTHLCWCHKTSPVHLPTTNAAWPSRFLICSRLQYLQYLVDLPPHFLNKFPSLTISRTLQNILESLACSLLGWLRLVSLEWGSVCSEVCLESCCLSTCCVLFYRGQHPRSLLPVPGSSRRVSTTLHGKWYHRWLSQRLRPQEPRNLWTFLVFLTI